MINTKRQEVREEIGANKKETQELKKENQKIQEDIKVLKEGTQAIKEGKILRTPKIKHLLKPRIFHR